MCSPTQVAEALHSGAEYYAEKIIIFAVKQQSSNFGPVRTKILSVP